MTILMVILHVSIYVKMVKNGHFVKNGHHQYGHEYGHVGYPWEQHKKTSLPVKQLGVKHILFKTYDNFHSFIFFYYVSLGKK